MFMLLAVKQERVILAQPNKKKAGSVIKQITKSFYDVVQNLVICLPNRTWIEHLYDTQKAVKVGSPITFGTQILTLKQKWKHFSMQ